MSVVMQSNEAVKPVWEYEKQSTAIYSTLRDILSYYNEVYSTQNGNNYILMIKSLTQSNKFDRNKAAKLLAIFKNKVQDLIIDFDEKVDYFEFLFDIRDSGAYGDFLVYAQRQKDLNVCNAISIFLSQKEYKNIGADEEKFILAMLKSNEAQLQEFALAAILNWDNFFNLNLLKAIDMQNKYLQEDLIDFIQSKA